MVGVGRGGTRDERLWRIGVLLAKRGWRRGRFGSVDGDGSSRSSNLVGEREGESRLFELEEMGKGGAKEKRKVSSRFLREASQKRVRETHEHVLLLKPRQQIPQVLVFRLLTLGGGDESGDLVFELKEERQREKGRRTARTSARCLSSKKTERTEVRRNLHPSRASPSSPCRERNRQTVRDQVPDGQIERRRWRPRGPREKERNNSLT